MKVAIYCCVSAHDQNCKQQERVLKEYAEKCGFKVEGVWSETKLETKQRKAIMKLAREGKIDSVWVTRLTQWGRSASDLVQTIEELHALNISLFSLDGFNCDRSTDRGEMIFGIIDMFAQFDRDSIAERRKLERSFMNIFGKTHWFCFKLLINILFGIIVTVLTAKQQTIIQGMYFLTFSIFTSSLMNSLDSFILGKSK
ncbi:MULTISPECIES: recombinase family protein [unclassified Chamaesiphon]|uniref:recombinase family protein n=1 Tax=unclassified Chamaesiphon TaxID=2620921 RepID=UPI00286C2234|nr:MULTISPECIES: recombinase family protein [unclassified Chamaesiphon]